MVKVLLCRITILALCSILLKETLGKPALDTAALSAPDVLTETEDQDASLLRDQRSPQYGFNDYDDYSYDGGARHFKNKHKHKPVYVPVVIQGGHGCRGHGHGCGGSYHKPSHGHGGGHGGSFASASAGSFGSGDHGGSNSQAQAASLSFGPISISTAQAQSSSRGGSYGGYGGYGDFGGFDY